MTLAETLEGSEYVFGLWRVSHCLKLPSRALISISVRVRLWVGEGISHIHWLTQMENVQSEYVFGLGRVSHLHTFKTKGNVNNCQSTSLGWGGYLTKAENKEAAIITRQSTSLGWGGYLTEIKTELW